MDLPIYKMVFNGKEHEGGLYGISLVNDPANQLNFITLNKEAIKLKIENKEKQIVSGAVLIPDQKIFRSNEEEGDHYIVFDKDTIEMLSHQFFMSKSNDNSWFDHDYSKQIKPTVIESWLISDSSNDKSNSLGFEGLPEGTWMLSMKLSDEDWQEYIKTNKARGFSIDAYLGKELLLKQHSKMENTMKRLMTMLKNHVKVKLATIEVDEKVLEAESFEEGSLVSFEGEPYADMVFDYMGYTYTTDKDGVITTVVQIEEVEVEVEDVELETEVEETVEEKEEPSDEVILAIIMDIISDSPAIDEALKAHYSQYSVDEVVEMYEEDEETKNKIHKLFSKEREALNKTITELKSELEVKPATTKLSAFNGKTSTTSRVGETTLEAISRINKSL